MDWNGNLRVPFVSRPDHNSYGYLYNYTNYDQFPVLEMKQPSMHGAPVQQALNLPTLVDKNMSINYSGGLDPKKKRLSNEQLELLENCFQEEIKLDPDRKMKLAKELGLQPRQIAVWFQNRRARWKGKQLERLYDALKQEFDTVSRDKQKLQQEVMALRAVLKDHQVGKLKQVSTEISGGEETVESTSINRSSQKLPATNQLHQIAECNYDPLNMEDYTNNNNSNSNINAVMMPHYWATPMHN
ncbi:hypothetical protein ACS0TY_016263 [Phlomoides rotata]